MSDHSGGAVALPEVRLIAPTRHLDARGYLSETYNRARWADWGIVCDFVQDNESLSLKPHTLRGLHFQTGDEAQAKLVRVVSGAIFDVVVDIRRGSPRFGRFQSFRLAAEQETQLFVPEGFAHGFCTLEPRTLVQYKVSRHHAPAQESGLRWDDPELAIPWPLDGAAPILSEKDLQLPFLRDHGALFVYRE